MSLFRTPRSRPTAAQPDAEPTEPAVATARSRPRPLPTPRPEPSPAGVAGAADEDDEYWDDEYDDEFDDSEDRAAGEGGAAHAGGRRRRRFLGRGAGRPGHPRRRGRRGRRTEPEAPVTIGADDAGTIGVAQPGVEGMPSPTPTPAPTPTPRPSPVPLQKGMPEPAVRRRRVPQVPVAAMRAGTTRRLAGARTGINRGWTGTRSGVTRGWTATRHGFAAAVHFVRTHWGRSAYIYLGVVAGALLVTFLLYWHSGFTYDECNYCGMPAVMSVSPWWLLILPFNVSQWPLFLPLVVLALFAGLNAELIDRWSKRPQPEYPDWD